MTEQNEIKDTENGGALPSSFKGKVIWLFSGLFMEKTDSGKLSLGRVSFWLAFIPALLIWINGDGAIKDGTALQDITPNHLTILTYLMVYNFGKKLTGAAKDFLRK